MESGTERRGLLRLFAFAFGAITGGAGLASLLDPLRGQAERWIALAPLETLPLGEAKRVKYTVRAGWEETQRSVYLLRDGETVRAIDARCTHLGCTVRYRDDQFVCPCHKGVFDGEGRPLSGPVNEPLARMETRVKNGVVEGRV